MQEIILCNVSGFQAHIVSGIKGAQAGCVYNVTWIFSNMASFYYAFIMLLFQTKQFRTLTSNVTFF